LNDEGFLRLVDRPIVMPGAHATLATLPGPALWPEAVLDVMAGLVDRDRA
jgi:hypothetical protein